MTDPIAQADAARRERDAVVVRELSRLCAQHGTTCHYVPTNGIYITLKHGVEVEWRWSNAQRASRVEVRCGEATPHEVADGLVAMAQVLLDPGFADALQLALGRTSEDSARAFKRFRDRVEQGERDYVARE